MTRFRGIDVVTEAGPRSGEKYRTPEGFTAIRNGVKARPGAVVPGRGGKPSWLRARVPGGGRYADLKGVVREHHLATVCEESLCPNIGECWGSGTATLMLMGKVCTRACRFCAVDTGNPRGWLDPEEPAHAARTVELMGLGYVVLTSVDRDDLADGGAAHYAACIEAIRARNPGTAVEALTPDFSGDAAAVRCVVAADLAVFAHNLETVRRLTPAVRDPRAHYAQSLAVLGLARAARDDILVKSSLMLGLGETADEVHEALRDLRGCGVDIVTLGQYLRPTPHHLPVVEYVTPERFAAYREAGLALGFTEVVAGPLVRSSYRAERALDRNNVGL
ncbi:MAG: lipoyl synthase [Gammaproteobacteria bacterium]|nr:lipoyl synthase [Gammaproteobacteria bacterium]